MSDLQARLVETGAGQYDEHGQLFLHVKSIKESKISLRPVNRDDEEYVQLVASVEAKGVLEPIQVRITSGRDDGPIEFLMINGLQRYTASCDLGLQWVPARIMTADEEEALDAQLLTNLIRVKTRPGQFTEHLKLMLAKNQTMTKNDLAKRLGVSKTFLDQRLSLSTLPPDVLQMIDEGAMPLSNAYALGKLPAEEVEAFVDAACTDNTNEFTRAVAERQAQIKKANKSGSDAEPPTFTPRAKFRKVSTIEGAIASPGSVVDDLIQEEVEVDPEQVSAILRWAVELDHVSLTAKKKSWDKKQLERAEKAERLKIEREERAEAARAARLSDVTRL